MDLGKALEGQALPDGLAQPLLHTVAGRVAFNKGEPLIVSSFLQQLAYHYTDVGISLTHTHTHTHPKYAMRGRLDTRVQRAELSQYSTGTHVQACLSIGPRIEGQALPVTC